MIEDYSFGKMTINGATYTSDLLIYPDKTVHDQWWRQSGHMLRLADIADMIATGPEVIVAGTGDSGLMKPEAGLEEALADRGIELITRPSKKAAALYNELVAIRRVAACFHLTC
ncbi:MAG: Mth938-like domain-containing protein [Desulfosudaceae bacterium]